MADVETANDRGSALVPGAHRVIRTLDAREGAFAGTLVTRGDGVAVRVDEASLGGWAGWRFCGAEHVAAPLDVIRRRVGHDVLLPWCSDRLRGLVDRRAAVGAVLTPGECTTLAISLLRGLDEMEEGVEAPRSGTWWLTDRGRPVCVLGEGPDVRTGVLEIVRALGEQSADRLLRRSLATIEEGIRRVGAQPRLPRRLLASWEQELLSIAAPQPLERRGSTPERAREVARTVASREPSAASQGQRLRAHRSRTGARRRDEARSRRVSDAVEAAVHAGEAAIARVRGTLPVRRAAPRKEKTAAPVGRRRVVVIAGTAAAAVLAAGLLWPEGEATGSAERASLASPSPAVTAPPTRPAVVPTLDGAGEVAETAPSATAPSAAAGDAVGAVAELLATIGGCRTAGDDSCSGAVATGSTGVVDALAGVDTASSTAELVDEYGDVAVVRLRVESLGNDEAVSSAEKMVVLIRAEQKWLVRDAYDVADQP